MSWRPGVNISWRWIIRGMCLGLLGLCVGLWGLSYFYQADVNCNGSSLLYLTVHDGQLTVYRLPGTVGLPPGWSADWFSAPVVTLFTLHLLDGDFLGFMSGHRGSTGFWQQGSSSFFSIPLWFPTALLAIASWIAWWKTGRGGTARGFPVESVESRRESGGG